MRYRLCTLLIVLALGPPVLAQETNLPIWASGESSPATTENQSNASVRTIESGRRTTAMKLRLLMIRDWFWLVVVVALALGWAIDRGQLSQRESWGGIKFFDHAERSLHSKAPGTTFTSEITAEALAGSPSWEACKPNPPLSAIEALTRADQLRRALVADDIYLVWQVESIQLEPGDAANGKWYWIVRYEAHPTAGPRDFGPLGELELVVHMNGTAVRPVQSPRVGGFF
jgi:hypothetical protein